MSFAVQLPWLAALSSNPCTGFLGGGTGGGGKFLSMADSFENVTYEVFGFVWGSKQKTSIQVKRLTDNYTRITPVEL